MGKSFFIENNLKRQKLEVKYLTVAGNICNKRL
jgi:hypothetical protein